MLPDHGALRQDGSGQYDGGKILAVTHQEREPMIQVCEWVEGAWLVGFGTTEGTFEIHLGKWIVRVSLRPR